MKKNLFTLLAAFVGFTSNGQTIESIIGSDIAQGEKMIEAYFTPMAESFGAGLNNGWYNTGKPHSLGGFDLTFTLNTVIIPNSAKTMKWEWIEGRYPDETNYTIAYTKLDGSKSQNSFVQASHGTSGNNDALIGEKILSICQ